MTKTNRKAIRLGLRANLAQFTLLVAINALVGGMLGQERSVLPLLAQKEFRLTNQSAALTYILAFGLAKAATNYFAGSWSDRYGRKPVLLAGWLLAIPVPLLLIWAPNWWWIVVANVLLGINQGLTWSTTVIMKVDLVGPERRGLAMGLNESAGYLAVAATALATGYLAEQFGLRPAPFLLGLSYAAIGLGLTVFFVRETHGHARFEARTHRRADSPAADLTEREVFSQTSFREPALSAASQAGMVNNLNDGLAWGLFPILFATTACRSPASVSSPRSTPPSGASGNSSPARYQTASAANTSSRWECSPKPPHLRWSLSPEASACGRPPSLSSVSALPRFIPPYWP